MPLHLIQVGAQRHNQDVVAVVEAAVKLVATADIQLVEADCRLLESKNMLVSTLVLHMIP